jgi:hypothetical protein
MCDYSLYAIPNRLAEDGEQVVLHRFGTGSIGFASIHDVPQQSRAPVSTWRSLRSALKTFLLPRMSPSVPAVCMPPGTCLAVSKVPDEVKRVHGLHSGDMVTVTEITSHSYSYRDGLVLPNGKCVLLQELPEGIEALVLFTALEEAIEIPTPARVFVG